MEHQETGHKRRVRYRGTHPRNYKEKYKELQPDKYADTIEKVIRKGSTPAGMHISICVEEILEFLQIHPGQTGLDATLGYGGHTERMLQCLEGKGHLHALDVDPEESQKTTKRLRDLGYGEDILTVHLMNFAHMDQVAEAAGGFDFVLADLGVSSMQIDNPDRGFSYKTEGPLDLRMNQQKGISAAERKEAVKKSCQRTFQALRIDVNNEYEALYEFLEKLPDVLRFGGRAAILTFHSGEDRLVKKSFKNLLSEGIYKEISQEAVRPSAEECKRNSRARSTKMRWAIRA